jgi:hypothetical protein
MRMPGSFSLWVLVCAWGVAPATGAFKLSDQDRVVLFGDTAVSEVRTLDWFDQFMRTRYPDRRPLVCNLGEPRCTVRGGLKRIEREVLPLAPTQVVLCFGLEGPERKRFDEARLQTHIRDLRTMIDEFASRDIAVTLMTPPPPDEGRNRGLKRIGYRETVARYAQAIRDLAQETELPLIDWHEAVLSRMREFKGPGRPGWTQHGLKPSWFSHAILTDLLLSHWGAEPLDYLIRARWNSAEAAATIGKIKVTEHDAHNLHLDLHGVPVVVNMLARQKMNDEEFPLSKWFRYRLQIDDAPPRGLVVSTADGSDPRALSAAQLSGGVDISTVGPLVAHGATRALHDAVLRKCNQYTQYRLAMGKTAPEPELERGFELMRQAEVAWALGAHQVAYRTPSRFDIKLHVTDSRAALKAAKSAKPGPKQRGRRLRGPGRKR